jgi:hypothetical protein
VSGELLPERTRRDHAVVDAEEAAKIVKRHASGAGTQTHEERLVDVDFTGRIQGGTKSQVGFADTVIRC